MRRGLDLGRFYLAVILGLTALLAGLFSLVLSSTREVVEQSAEKLRRAATAKAGDRVGQSLAVAEHAVAGLELQLADGLAGDRLEAALFHELLRQPALTEMTYTWPTGQLSVARVSDAGDVRRIITRRRERTDAGWTLEVRPRPPGGGFDSAGWVAGLPDGTDPTEHATYTTPARLPGRALWSDLAFSELDAYLPEARRRIVMTVQKGLAGGGVLRAGLLSDDIDRIGRMRVDEGDAADPQRVFLCDRLGRLITRLDPAGGFAVTPDDDVRVAGAAPAHLAAALADPRLGEATADAPLVSRSGGQVVTISPLRDDRTRGWLVGVAAPESFYLAGLTGARDRLLVFSALLMAGVLAGGALSLRAIRAGLARVVGETTRMRRFDFAPARARSAFADVNEALHSLEVAKTALRAMGRYVPIDLVRQLYREGREPTLGGELVQVSLMFSDIKDFTTASERLSPDELAAALGKYLEVMTAAISATGGTIDKFIGDAVMVFWNAPLPAADHAARACRAALGCAAALEELFDSPAWRGLPRWTTRFGLHTAEVMVGHFGAPERLSYTALGDGVNLASRLEGLNKAYGTTILVSGALRAAAPDAGSYRHLDRVAVKGKTEAIDVYELIDGPATPATRRYEEALDHYVAGRFADAVALLDAQPGDPPSEKLAARCRALVADPPQAWDGVYRASEK